jgi:hypothetical protein
LPLPPSAAPPSSSLVRLRRLQPLLGGECTGASSSLSMMAPLLSAAVLHPASTAATVNRRTHTTLDRSAASLSLSARSLLSLCGEGAGGADASHGEGFGVQQRRWRAAECGHPSRPREDGLTHPEDASKIQSLLLPWLCFRGGGFPTRERQRRRWGRSARTHLQQRSRGRSPPTTEPPTIVVCAGMCPGVLRRWRRECVVCTAAVRWHQRATRGWVWAE